MESESKRIKSNVIKVAPGQRKELLDLAKELNRSNMAYIKYPYEVIDYLLRFYKQKSGMAEGSSRNLKNG